MTEFSPFLFPQATRLCTWAVEKFPSCSQWLGFAGTQAYLGVLTPEQEKPPSKSKPAFRKGKTLQWMRTRFFLSGTHFPQKQWLSLMFLHFFKVQAPKLLAVPSCSLNSSIPKGQISSENSLHSSKPCHLRSTEDERGTRDIQWYIILQEQVGFKVNAMALLWNNLSI